MTVLLCAGLLKGLDVDSFEASLRAWQTVPDAIRAPIAVGLPLLEVALAVLWFTLDDNRLPARLAVAAITIFTVAYSVEWAIATAPECACFGRWQAFRERQADGWQVVVRNLLLIALIAWGIALDAKGR